MNQIADIVKSWSNMALDFIPGTSELEQLWFIVMVLGGFVGAFLLFSAVKMIAFLLSWPKRRKKKREAMAQDLAIKQALSQVSGTEAFGAKASGTKNNPIARDVDVQQSLQQRQIPKGQGLLEKSSNQGKVAKVQIFIDYANFDKNWVDNAYGLLAEGNQKVRLDWNKLTDVVMREVQGALTSWQSDIVYAGTFVQASVLPERFTTPRAYKLPKALAANYYIYAKDAELVRSKLDGKEYIAKKLHPTHSFLKFIMRKLPGYNVNISRRVIARNHDGSPVVMTSKSGIQYIKSGEKAVDSKVIADMTAGAMSDGCDIVVLLGSDTDFLPVIETIQKGFNKPVIHVGFERGGHQVRSACWSHVVLDKRLVSELREPSKVIPAAAKAVSTAVSAVAARVASPAEQETVKQVVQLFTSEAAAKPMEAGAVESSVEAVTKDNIEPTIKQDVAPRDEKSIFEESLSTKVEGK